MSKFTTEVRFVCETAAGLNSSKGFNSLEDTLTAAAPKVFDFDFPIFDENYRLVLEKKILRHYYTREIGEETVGLWKLRLNTRLNEIMPYYNKLYESELLEFNPFYDTDYTRTGKREGTGTDNISGANTKTGTIQDDGFTYGSDAMRGTVGETATANGTETMTGTVGEVGHSSGNRNDNKTSTEERAKTGTESTAKRGTTEKENVLNTFRTNGGRDTTTEHNNAKNDHWDYYSDTPQGTIGYVPGSGGDAIANQTYLTNVRHITDNTKGSEKETVTQHGMTVADTGSTTEITTHNTTDTLTYDTNEGVNRADIGETTESGTTDKTTTHDTMNSKDSQSNNTTTYNTTNTKDVEDSNTRTFNTSDNTQTEKLSTNLDEYSERVFGKRNPKSYAKLLLEFRETFLNIDMLIINQLSDLFMGLWD